MRIVFVGAGPGNPELITLKGKRYLEQADMVIYAGSLVNPELLNYVPEGCTVLDSSGMTLEEVLGIYEENSQKGGLIVRLHTGDPSLYGAIQEQLDFCAERKISTEVVPGVSSVFAAAAALKRELTLPGMSQTLILTRKSGRTAVPASEALGSLASHGATLAVFLSATLLDELVAELLPAYGAFCPVRIVYRASWPDQQIMEGCLSDICSKATGLSGQAMILVGPVLNASMEEYSKSKLYDSAFSHGRRKGQDL